MSPPGVLPNVQLLRVGYWVLIDHYLCICMYFVEKRKKDRYTYICRSYASCYTYLHARNRPVCLFRVSKMRKTHVQHVHCFYFFHCNQIEFGEVLHNQQLDRHSCRWLGLLHCLTDSVFWRWSKLNGSKTTVNELRHRIAAIQWWTNWLITVNLLEFSCNGIKAALDCRWTRQVTAMQWTHKIYQFKPINHC